ncbi:MAG: helix-turn-helix domain-containing protein [Lachnospiraceae bacterium]|nr:helix-turn-helix domain-containing protein [Lachnospiraceae bacterium]
MVSRIIQIRKENKLSQEQFANKIGLSRNFINQVETNKKNISDRTISDICREFSINEEWLRNGKGEMYKIPEDETAMIVSDLLIKENNPLYDIILGIAKVYQQLDNKSQDTILNFSQELLNTLQKEKKG